MREHLIQFLVSRLGSALMVIVNAFVAYVIACISQSYPVFADIANVQEIAGFVWGLLMIFVNYATTRWLTKDAKIIQESLREQGADIPVDGWIGPKTINAYDEINTPNK